MSNYKCIIFDCDGVLVDSEPLGNRVLVDMANQLGADIDLDYAYKHFKGGSIQSCMVKLSELIDSELPKDFETRYRQQSFEVFRNEIQPVEGVHDLIKTLKLPYCVASSGPEDKIRLNLKQTGLLPFFEHKIFSCHSIQKWKPDPAVFLWAAETMGFKPHECLVIEDSLTGIEAAKRGGFTVFGFTAHDYSNELKSEADYVFDAMIQLKELL